MRFLHSSIVAVVLVRALIFTPAIGAQSVNDVPPGPVPRQISTAKKVFVSNGGCDFVRSTIFTGAPLFTGEPDRCYNQFYAALNKLGRYEVVSAPADADLVLEISFFFSTTSGFQYGNATSRGEVPEFRLVVSDPRNRAVLWTFIQYVELAARIRNRDRNFGQALDRLVQDLKMLATSPTARTAPAPQ